MSVNKFAKLPQILGACSTEEEVKAEIAKAFKIKVNTKQRIDLYTSRVLFEFKFDRNFQSTEARAGILAQTMYYLREIKFGSSNLVIPNFICAIDRNQAFLASSAVFKKFYGDQNNKYDWDRAPSTPCPKLVQDLANAEAVKTIHSYEFQNGEDFANFADLLNKYLNEQLAIDFSETDKKSISEENFDAAYTLWSGLFGAYLEDDHKLSEYFMSDIQHGRTYILNESHEVAFDLGNGLLVKKPIPIDKYQYFWNTYAKCQDSKTVNSIWQRVDRLSVEDFRRFTGEFYTPVKFAAKGVKYLEDVIGERWWERGYRLWDMAAGTGNLEYSLPEEALPFSYISTLLKEDSDYCARLYPSATVFQYDYLNDDVNLLYNTEVDLLKAGVQTKMPAKLFSELNDPEIKWIIFINPPFATSNVGARDTDVSKDSVSMTDVRSLMGFEDLGETSRELFSQFLWRIGKEFKDREAHLGMFSKIKYINANNDQKMRDSFFKYKFEKGFCFPSRTFHGNKGNFPVGFLVWGLANDLHLSQQKITLDVFNENIEKIGFKEVPAVDREDALSKWVPRIRNSAILPPLTNAITVGDSHKDVRDGVAEGFLFSLMAKGNDFANQNATALLSGPYVSAGGFSVTPENFERAIVVHAVRRMPKATWLNDRDQWMQPSTNNLDQDFLTNCAVWSAFANSNQTAALAGIKYKGQNYDLKNELFPFTIEAVSDWEITLSKVQDSFNAAKGNRFLATWLKGKVLTREAQDVMDSGKEIYELFYKHLSGLPWPQYKISTWDVGWYQIRRSLTDSDLASNLLKKLQAQMTLLERSTLPRMYEYGFMQGAEHLFADDLAV